VEKKPGSVRAIIISLSNCDLNGTPCPRGY
jgi:hypothetical protein